MSKCEGCQKYADCSSGSMGGLTWPCGAYVPRQGEVQTLKYAEWIYNSIDAPSSEFEQTISAVEKALGFRLFAWQKTYIAYGYFRQLGATTAEILRDLLDVSGEPIDHSKRAANESERFYRRELRKIKEKLDSAKIPTRAVFFSEADKRAHKREERKTAGNNFKCKAESAGYCKKWLRACVGWNNCDLEGYGAPCPGCEDSSPLDNERCKSCMHNAWKNENYIP